MMNGQQNCGKWFKPDISKGIWLKTSPLPYGLTPFI